MLVLATFLPVGVFFVAFLFWFMYALHSEIRIENQRSARTRQIASRRIPIAIEVRRPTRGFIVTSSNPGLVFSGEPKAGLPGSPMRRALAALSGMTVHLTESSQTKRQA